MCAPLAGTLGAHRKAPESIGKPFGNSDQARMLLTQFAAPDIEHSARGCAQRNVFKRACVRISYTMRRHGEVILEPLSLSLHHPATVW